MELKDIVTLSKNKKDEIKINLSYASLCELLKEHGFGITKINKNDVLYKRIGNDLIHINFFDIEDEVCRLINSITWMCNNEIVNSKYITDWCVENEVIKMNAIFHSCLFEILSLNDMHILRFKVDLDYVHCFQNQSLLLFFKDFNFINKIDKSGIFLSNAPLYYKSLRKNKYLVFSHYNSKNKLSDGFDCWICYFKHASDIGTLDPIKEIDCVKLNFKLSSDSDLIRNYL